MNYLVVLFKNKEKKKIIKQFKNFDRSNSFYEKLISENEKVIFEKKVENCGYSEYEICLLQKKDDSFEKLFVRDDLGRQVLVSLDDPEYKIIKIKPYKIPEKIFDVISNKKISVESFIKKYLPKTNIKLVSRLNNKIIVQNDNLTYLFSLKNEDESFRFLTILNKHFSELGRIDTIIVIDTSKEQKKYLYDILSEKGFEKRVLYRKSTTFKPR
jgi:hypothetical protein